jgi:HEAT repeat protein
MYSDDEIRQIILDVWDEESSNFNKSYKILSKTQDKRFLNVAIVMLQGEDDNQIAAALNALWWTQQFDSSNYLPQVLPLLDNPLHWTKTLSLIKRIGNANVFPRILPFLFYPDLEARREALRVLYVLSYPEILEICLHLVNDNDVTMRVCAILILEELKNPLAVESLIGKLYDHEAEDNDHYQVSISTYAARALGKIKDKGAVEALKIAVSYGNEQLSKTALFALWSIEGTSLVEFYAEQIYHPHELTRTEAIRFLSETKNADFVYELISVSQRDSCYGVQLAAAAALFKLGTKESLDAAAYWEKHFRRKS